MKKHYTEVSNAALDSLEAMVKKLDAENVRLMQFAEQVANLNPDGLGVSETDLRTAIKEARELTQ